MKTIHFAEGVETAELTQVVARNGHILRLRRGEQFTKFADQEEIAILKLLNVLLPKLLAMHGTPRKSL
jgi:hypothetical protein